MKNVNLIPANIPMSTFFRIFRWQQIPKNIIGFSGAFFKQKIIMPPKRKAAATTLEVPTENSEISKKVKPEASKNVVKVRGAQLKSEDFESDASPLIDTKTSASETKADPEIQKSKKKVISKEAKAASEKPLLTKKEKLAPTKKEKSIPTKKGEAILNEKEEPVPTKKKKPEPTKKEKPVPSKKVVTEKIQKKHTSAEEAEAVPKKKVKKEKSDHNDKKVESEETDKKKKVLAKTKKKSAKKEVEDSENGKEEQSNLKNQTETDWTGINFGCNRKNTKNQSPNLKITSWNVDGLRAWVKKQGLKILDYDSPDILCLQETKCTADFLPEDISGIENYHKYWTASDKNGYAGVGLLCKKMPLNVSYGIGDEEQDIDGRCITAEFEKFFLITVYVPNAGRKLVTLDKRLAWNEAFKEYILKLDKEKPVIICGDMNVAHNEIDLKNPKTNKRNAGFTQEERDGMTDFLEVGFVDTFRTLYPDTAAYTFWTYMMNSRKKNVGWRLDYFLVSERLRDNVCDNVVHDQIFGSDHCPITLFINI